MIALILFIVATFVLISLYKSLGKNEYSTLQEKIVIKPAVEVSNKGNNAQNSAYSNQIAPKILELKNIYPDFVAEVFIKEAEQTFDDVFNAFASSQHQVLKSKLSESLYEQFASQIKKREDNNLRQEISIVHKNTEIENVKINSLEVELTVKFVVEQVSAMVDVNGVSYDNPSKLARKVQHTWVFVSHNNELPTKWIITKTSAKEI